MKENDTKKGHSILKVAIKDSHKSIPINGLEKVPMEGLLKIAREEIGQLESYIDELKDKIRSFEKERKIILQQEKGSLLREIQKEAVMEAKKTEVVQKLKRKTEKQNVVIQQLYASRNELIIENLRLKKLLEQQPHIDNSLKEINP